MVHHRGMPVRHRGGMAEPVKVRRLSDEEGRKLQRLVRRGEGQGKTSVVRYRRALVILASTGGNTVPVIAWLVQTSPVRVPEEAIVRRSTVVVARNYFHGLRRT
jgi:hypothetical protein